MEDEPDSLLVQLGAVALRVIEHSGASPAVIALHGLAGHGREWDALAASLPGRRIVVPDLRGHGASDWADDYRLAAFADDIAKLIVEWGLAPAVVIGHSLGGAVGITVDAHHPELLAGLIVVDIGPELPAALLDQMATQEPRPTTFPNPRAAAESLRATNPYASREALEHRVRHGLVETDAGVWTWRHDPALLLPGLPDAADLWQLWRQTTSPTLVVRGEHSLYLDEALAARMAAARSDVEVAVVPAAGHNVPTDAPEAFGRVVARWVRKLEPRSPGGPSRNSGTRPGNAP